jgi:hypothetical protein
MTKNFIYLLISSFLFLQGCSSLAKLAYGIHQPKRLTENEMHKEYTKVGLLGEKILVFPDDTAYAFFLDQKKPSINFVYIFDKQGYRLIPKDSLTCSADNHNFLSNYQKDGMVYRDSSFHISYFKPFKLLGDTSSIIDLQDEKENYVIILGFADFAGKLNEQTTLKYLHTLSLEQKENEQVYLLTLDPSVRKKGMIESLPFK